MNHELETEDQRTDQDRGVRAPEPKPEEDLPPPQYEVEDAEAGGTADPSAKFRAEEVDPQEVEEIERERAERLDPENRPPNAEVDNTQRTFDPERGDFID